jgi:N-acetylglutamate synthase-like GNAT family acetyltransferase
MQQYEVYQNSFLISTNKSKIDIDVVHNYLSSESYWAKNIPIKVVKTSIENSVCFSLYKINEQTKIIEKQIGFARVVTDCATFGYLADVFVVEEYRGKGLSKWLMQVILEHPQLQNFRRWMLATLDAHGLYAQFGFKPIDNPERYMRLTVVENY